MSEASARVGVWNRHILAGFWALFGLGCVLLPLSKALRESNILPYSPVIGACFLVGAVAFYVGWKWGRVAIGVLVAPLSLLCFNRAMELHFQSYHGPYFWVCFVLLAVGFYTWVFIFTGLDRDALRSRYRSDDEVV